MPVVDSPTQPLPEVLTLEAVCDLLHVDLKTLWRWRRDPVRPFPVSKPSTGPGAVFVLRSELLRWLKDCEESPVRSTPRRARKTTRATAR